MNHYGVRRGVRLVHDPVRQTDVVLYPEGVLLLNETASDIVRLSDGRRGRAQITEELSHAYEGVTAASVGSLLDDLVARRILVADGSGGEVELSLTGGEG